MTQQEPEASNQTMPHCHECVQGKLFGQKKHNAASDVTTTNEYMLGEAGKIEERSGPWTEGLEA